MIIRRFTLKRSTSCLGKPSQGGIRILEFGCGGGMNLLRLISMLNSSGIHTAQAIGTDFSPAMVETARREAKDYLRGQDFHSLQFYVARNEKLD